MTTHDQHTSHDPRAESIHPTEGLTPADERLAPTSGQLDRPIERLDPPREYDNREFDNREYDSQQGTNDAWSASADQSFQQPADQSFQQPTDQVQPSSEQSTVRTESAAPVAESFTADVQPSSPQAEASPVADESLSDRSLFADDELSGLRARWDHVQAGFVDDPKECVQKADGLVSDVVEQLTRSFSDARTRLEEQWARGEDASTEDLRVALKRYREFFQRLLAV